MKEENKNAIEIIKQMIADGQIAQNVAEKYFPELRESEDERIRKEIISYIKANVRAGELYESWIAWLERQGEQKPAWSEKDIKIIDNIEWALIDKNVKEKTPNRYRDEFDWLKSLRPQNRWKPSDEQMELLREVQQALLGKDCHNRFVNFMYELKWLREE